MAGDSGDSAIDAVPGGLVIRSSKKENGFKAPAPRTSLLGTSCRILSGSSMHNSHYDKRCFAGGKVLF